MLVSRPTSPRTHRRISSSLRAPVRSDSSIAFHTATASLAAPPRRGLPPPADPPPIADRSFISVVSEARQPSPSAPIRLASGTRHFGHVDLVELGLTGDLAQRAHLDALGVHVEREVGHALVLGKIGVAAGDEHAPVGEVGERVPHLLAVDDPLVTVSHRFGRETGEVGTGAGFGEQLTPLLLAREHRSQEAALLLVAAVGDDRGAGERHEERGRVGCGSAGFTEPPIDVTVEVGPQSEAAEADREVHPSEPRVIARTAQLDVGDPGGIVGCEHGVDRRIDLLEG